MSSPNPLALAPFDAARSFTDLTVALDELADLLATFRPRVRVSKIIRYSTLPYDELAREVAGVESIRIELFSPDVEPEEVITTDGETAYRLTPDIEPENKYLLGWWGPEGNVLSDCIACELDRENRRPRSADQMIPLYAFPVAYFFDAEVKPIRDDPEGLTEWKKLRSTKWADAYRLIERFDIAMQRGELHLLDSPPSWAMTFLEELYDRFTALRTRCGGLKKEVPNWAVNPNGAAPYSARELSDLGFALQMAGENCGLLRDAETGAFTSNLDALSTGRPFLTPNIWVMDEPRLSVLRSELHTLYPRCGFEEVQETRDESNESAPFPVWIGQCPTCGYTLKSKYAYPLRNVAENLYRACGKRESARLAQHDQATAETPPNGFTEDDYVSGKIPLRCHWDFEQRFRRERSEVDLSSSLDPLVQAWRAEHTKDRREDSQVKRSFREARGKAKKEKWVSSNTIKRENSLFAD